MAKAVESTAQATRRINHAIQDRPRPDRAGRLNGPIGARMVHAALNYKFGYLLNAYKWVTVASMNHWTHAAWIMISNPAGTNGASWNPVVPSVGAL